MREEAVMVYQNDPSQHASVADCINRRRATSGTYPQPSKKDNNGSIWKLSAAINAQKTRESAKETACPACWCVERNKTDRSNVPAMSPAATEYQRTDFWKRRSLAWHWSRLFHNHSGSRVRPARDFQLQNHVGKTSSKNDLQSDQLPNV